MDFRSQDLEKIEIKSSQLEVLDYRNIQEPLKILESLMHQPSIMLWAEGQERKAVDGRDRHGLETAAALIFWTIPPSPDELRAVLAKVHPQTIYLFAVTDPVEGPDRFLGRLAGLLKYSINQRNGKVTYSELESATAQRAVTVRKGVSWLVSQGGIVVKLEQDNDLIVDIGSSQKDSAKGSQLWTEIQSLLAETAAYREYFKHADKDSLFD